MKRAFTLGDFLIESDRIEGIETTSISEGIDSLVRAFLERDKISVEIMSALVMTLYGARLRDSRGMDVRVGAHRPPHGGPWVVDGLSNLLVNAWNGVGSSEAYTVHREYETLHPFMDGNGRSGRLLWLWMMGGIEKAPLGFLHHWYYHSLDAKR